MYLRMVRLWVLSGLITIPATWKTSAMTDFPLIISTPSSSIADLPLNIALMSGTSPTAPPFVPSTTF